MLLCGFLWKGRRWITVGELGSDIPQQLLGSNYLFFPCSQCWVIYDSLSPWWKQDGSTPVFTTPLTHKEHVCKFVTCWVTGGAGENPLAGAGPSPDPLNQFCFQVHWCLPIDLPLSFLLHYTKLLLEFLQVIIDHVFSSKVVNLRCFRQKQSTLYVFKTYEILLGVVLQWTLHNAEHRADLSLNRTFPN